MTDSHDDGDYFLNVHQFEVYFRTDFGIVPAVKGVDFSMASGRTFAIVGESGSGKSVIAQAIMGLLPETARIADGSIHFHDRRDGGPVDIIALGQDSKQMRALRGRRIGMIFQDPMSSFSPVHTIGDQVTEGLRLHEKVTKAQAAEAAMALFERVGFRNPKDMLQTYPFELSGGMRQRAMIAMALICKPSLLIADEPTTALDVTTQGQILDLLKDLQAQFGMAIMLITHDLGVVATMADKVAVMYRGSLMERGTREQIFHDPQHPYLKALMRAVPRFHMVPGERLVPVRAIKLPPHLIERPTDASTREGTAKGGTAQDGATAGPCAEDRVVLAIENVSTSFLPRRSAWASGAQRVVRALTDVSFTVKAGTTLGLVGESGSGKTTLARIIMAAYPPDQGRVCFDDGRGLRDIFSLNARDLKAYRRTAQFVFQDPFSSLNPRMTVSDLLCEPLIIHGLGTKAERCERAATLLEVVGLDRCALRRYPHSFSGGQRQRIGLARALALSPSLLVCDEPTSALDVSVQAQILNLLKDLQDRLGLSYLFISHNLAVIDYMAREVVVLAQGLVVERARREHLFEHPHHPYTQALIAAVPKLDLDHPRDGAKPCQGAGRERADWPEPFRIAGPPEVSRMIEVGPGHFVRIGGAGEAQAS